MAEDTKTEKEKFAVKMAKRKIWFIFGCAMIYAGLIGLIVIFIQPESQGVWWMFLLVYTLAGIKIVRPEEVGSIICLGYAVREVRGLGWGPLGFSRLQTDPGVQIRLRIGTPVTKSNGDEVPMKDDSDSKLYVRSEPVRITFANLSSANYDDKFIKGIGEKKDQDPDDPLNQRLTPDPNLLLVWKIENHPRFLEEVGTIAAANQIVEESGIPALSEMAGQLTPAMAIRHQAQVEAHISSRVEIRVGEYDANDPLSIKPTSDGGVQQRYTWLGIDFLTAQVKTWGLPKDVNKAQATARASGFAAEGAVNTAKGEKQKRIIESEGEKRKRENEGAGTASARQAFLMAEAVGAAELAKQTNTSEGLINQWLQTMRGAFENAEYSILPGSQNILSPEGFTTAAAGIVETVRKLDSAKKGETTK